mgnify:CR=1 FL=1
MKKNERTKIMSKNGKRSSSAVNEQANNFAQTQSQLAQNNSIIDEYVHSISRDAFVSRQKSSQGGEQLMSIVNANPMYQEITARVKRLLLDVAVRVVANCSDDRGKQSVLEKLQSIRQRVLDDCVGCCCESAVLVNAMNRAMHVCREEISFCVDANDDDLESGSSNKKKSGSSSGSVITNSINNNSSDMKEFKQNVIEGLRELANEIDQAKQGVSEFACEIVSSDSVVVCVGRDSLVESFLKAAARKRRIKVIVLESSCNYDDGGKMMAEEFAKKLLSVGGGGDRANGSNNNNNNINSVEVTIAPESNAFALMSRAHVAIVSAQLGVFEDGSFFGTPGSRNIAMACKKFAVPLVALAPSLSIMSTQKVSLRENSLQRNGNPCEVLKNFRARSDISGRDCDAVLHPRRDFVEKEFVSAYVTDHGVCAPNAIESLARELYDVNDRERQSGENILL